MKENIFENKVQNRIDDSANYEGNETLLFYERLHNQKIREQLINTYIHYYDTQDKPFLVQEFDGNGKGIDVTDQWRKTVKTKEQINEELKEKIKTTFSQTGIDYSKEGASCMDDDFGFGTIFFQSVNPQTGEKYSNKQLSIIEAHEKGHFIRNFSKPGKLFKSEILKGFDFSKVEINSKRLNELKEKSSFDIPITVIKENEIEYFKRPMEIFERMAQFKNYFGMKGSEEFTKKHLDYIRSNYITDTKIPEFQIKPFLDAITPETEKDFLNLINSSGV